MLHWITTFLLGHVPHAIMANPLILGGVLAGTGLLKSLTLDKAKEDRQRKLAAETARYSPWTGMQPGQIQEADPFGSALQFGTTGAMLGQGMDAMKGGSAWGGMPGGPYANPEDYSPVLRNYMSGGK